MALDRTFVPAPMAATHETWPPNYTTVFQWRQQQLEKMRNDPDIMAGALEYYRTRPVEFILHWVDTYDPRKASQGLPTYMPFIMFERQVQYIEFLERLQKAEANGLVEKCRDAGVTWISVAYSWHSWRFKTGVSIGWGSRKEQLVDKIGDVDSILEKMRVISKRMPKEFLPRDFNPRIHQGYMKFVNPEKGSTVTGEAGDNIGRGGRKSIYFKDESAHYERPELIEASLGDNTNTQVDISSVNGLGNVFHRRRESGVDWDETVVMEKAETYVFVFDWSDHPDKDQVWYDRRKAKARADGLLHIFAQEVDRKYDSSVVGTIIPSEWVDAAVDAHLKLGFTASGKAYAGLDVADGGSDSNALAGRKGPVLLFCDGWGSSDVDDTGESTRRVVEGLEGLNEPWSVQYDCIGVGSGVKAEVNRLTALPKNDPKRMPDHIEFAPWAASAEPLDKDKHIATLENGLPDRKSPKNGDVFFGMKDQGWFKLADRFRKTWRMINEGVEYPHEELISLPSDLENLEQIKKELSQATMGHSFGAHKMRVNKSPKGTKSPNNADAIVMAFWPVTTAEFHFGMILSKRNR
jgi:hypothetical protein